MSSSTPTLLATLLAIYRVEKFDLAARAGIGRSTLDRIVDGAMDHDPHATTWLGIAIALSGIIGRNVCRAEVQRLARARLQDPMYASDEIRRALSGPGKSPKSR